MKNFLLFFFLIITTLSFAQDKKTDVKKEQKVESTPKEEKKVSAPAILPLRKVLESALNNYPKVLMGQEEIEAQKGNVRAEKGSFDLKLKGDSDARTRGYYQGRSAKLQLIKPLPIAGMSVSGGYRTSRGDFPSYEGKTVTGENGEFSLGLSFSILRNFSIDQNRLNLWDAKLKLKISESDLQLKLLEVQRKAIKAYADWAKASKTVGVYQSILEIAQKRQNALRRRVKKGDLAQIYLAENQQYILKRTTELEIAKQELQVARLELSLYYRDDNGRPIVLDDSTTTKNYDLVPYGKAETELDIAMKRSPTLDILNFEIERQNLQESMGENELLPALNVRAEASKDQGKRKAPLGPEENRVGVYLEIPLERNKGKGKIAKAKSKKMKLVYQKRLLVNEMEAYITAVITRLDTLDKLKDITFQEFKLAQRLQKAEVQKFNQGDSDFFVVNIREQSLANAEVKNIKANYDFLKTYADYLLLTFQMMK